MAVMSRFAILLGGRLTVTPRLLSQIEGARVLAADSGMIHAEPLGVDPILWVGDFDSAGPDLFVRHVNVLRKPYPAAKDATDGEIAIDIALKEGATEIILIGGFGGQSDHTLGHFGLLLRLARSGITTFMTSGDEEAHPLLPGEHRFDRAEGDRFSIIPFADLHGLDIEGVSWPLVQRHVPLGSSLTMSNVATGPVTVRLSSGYAIAIATPDDAA
jgi:thiamine pyrophosphokinase